MRPSSTLDNCSGIYSLESVLYFTFIVVNFSMRNHLNNEVKKKLQMLSQEGGGRMEKRSVIEMILASKVIRVAPYPLAQSVVTKAVTVLNSSDSYSAMN